MARAKLSRTVLTLGLSGNRLCPLLSPASRVARELCWEAEWRGAVGQPALAGACAVHCSSLPLCFLDLSIGCANCRKELQSLRLAAAAGTCLGEPGSHGEG